jgi:hypothetical protein
VIVHRPRDLKDLTPVLRQNIRTTNVLRLLCDLGAVDPTAVSNAVGHVVTTRLASPVALRAAIDRHSCRGRHGVPAFRAALEEWVIDGKPVDDVLETAMHRLLQDHHLPPAEFHARLAGYEVDFWIIGSPVVLECDGWEFHAKTRAQQEGTGCATPSWPQPATSRSGCLPPVDAASRRARPEDPQRAAPMGARARSGRGESRVRDSPRPDGWMTLSAPRWTRARQSLPRSPSIWARISPPLNWSVCTFT